MQVRYKMALMLLLGSVQAMAAGSNIDDKIDQCNQALNNGDTSRALDYADEVLKQDAANREALLCKGRALVESGQYPEALVTMQAAQRFSATPIERIVALSLTGNVQKEAKRYDEALATYRQSLAIAQAENDIRFERINHNLIGETLIETNQLDAALESYLIGGELAANDTERADNYSRIAQTYSSLGKHDQAVEYQIKTVLSEERSGDFNQFAYASLELGRIHTVAADYVNAEKVLHRLIDRSKSQGAPFWEAKAYYYLALEKIATSQLAEAKDLLTQAQQISQEIGADALNAEVSQTLSKM
jgi:tetratricopeptide (TPR) repeat protein